MRQETFLGRADMVEPSGWWMIKGSNEGERVILPKRVKVYELGINPQQYVSNAPATSD
jgi:hypothetical protein